MPNSGYEAGTFELNAGNGRDECERPDPSRTGQLVGAACKRLLGAAHWPSSRITFFAKAQSCGRASRYPISGYPLSHFPLPAVPFRFPALPFSRFPFPVSRFSSLA